MLLIILPQYGGDNRKALKRKILSYIKESIRLSQDSEGAVSNLFETAPGFKDFVLPHGLTYLYPVRYTGHPSWCIASLQTMLSGLLIDNICDSHKFIVDLAML